jgi:hypothetical protein
LCYVSAYAVNTGTNLAFIPLVFFCYPETKNLTLEEIDVLFIKEGKKGLAQLKARSQPVQESLRPIAEIEKDVERQGMSEKYAVQDVEDDHVEGKDEKIED